MNLIELQGISKEYYLGPQVIPVLHAIDLNVASGEFISIMGPSGSGKSTLMNILGCLDRPTSGTYLLRGHRVDSLEDAELSQVRNSDIGFVFQKFNLLEESNVIQNIVLPLVYRGTGNNLRREQALALARSMGIEARRHHKPTELSGGQAQRVAIARALIGKPSIILADEPTGNLDSQTGNEIIEIFRQLHRHGHTIIMVTHDAKLAEQAERIVQLRDGRIESQEYRSASAKTPVGTQTPEDDRGQGRFRWRDLLRISLREGLLSHPMRTALTMLGVLFGVSAVIAMVAINEGARLEAIEQIQQLGLYNIRIRKLKMSQEELKEARRNLSKGLDQNDLAAVRSVPTVRYAVPLKQIDAEITFGHHKPRGRIVATLPVYQRVANFYPQRGRFLNQEDLRFYRRVCVLGKSIRQELFANAEAIGAKIHLGAEVFTVIGVMEGKNEPRGVAKAVSTHNLNHDIYLPLTTAEKRFHHKPFANRYDEISVMVRAGNEVHSTSKLLARLLSDRHHQVNDFELVVPEELLRQSRKTQEIFDVVMVCIAGISLIVGGIGIMNIMLANVTERIPEIGIRRAVGANRHDILKQFLVEALAISIVGGLLGIAFGWGITLGISNYTGWKTMVSLASIFLGFGVSAIVGIAFGIYPAWRAALLNPIHALNST